MVSPITGKIGGFLPKPGIRFSNRIVISCSRPRRSQRADLWNAVRFSRERFLSRSLAFDETATKQRKVPDRRGRLRAAGRIPSNPPANRNINPV
ncbi:hypothetical protein [Burkholderia sp.]|uniref:hypothetical protein n=1 Tax=Burkholderia sp. TaxID=36773 RepID=UPI0025C73747|nr:hypothetical protein [Burkholderia sp.]MBS6361478.1 hypothetical protein [Burkholderia sp.]